MTTETASQSHHYAGRLTPTTSKTGVPGYSQSFSYNRAGSMTENIRVGAYAYGAARPRHAPVTVTKGGTVTTLTCDANGNMLTGLDGKVMTHDSKNRPLSVTFAGKKTRFTSVARTAPA